jgi:aspartate/methionine/tyrosine aminotransferase
VAPFIAMDVMREAHGLAAQGRRILHLEVGQPGTKAPLLARQAAARALEDDKIGYTDALGRQALRERIARHYLDLYGVTVSPERVVITTGSSAGFILAFSGLFSAGDGIILAEPGYPAYRNLLQAFDLRGLFVSAKAENRFQPVPADLAQIKRNDPSARGLLIASPANPTGCLLDRPALEALALECRAQSLTLISDEIYHGLTYERPAVSALEVDDQAIIINSFSKYFSMTGWRIGWMIVPEYMARPMERLAQNLFISAPTLSQIAALAAMDASAECEANRQAYARSRAVLLDALSRSGFGPVAPADGGFYLYVNTAPLSNDSTELCRRLLHEGGIAATPGHDFDTMRGASSLRLSYAGPESDMIEAAKILEAWR